MNYRSGVVTGILCTIAVLLIVWRLISTEPAGATKNPATNVPAKVAKPVSEEGLNTVQLTAEAVERLAIATAAVERKAVRRVRVYGGEVIVPAGQALVVSSPVNGILALSEKETPKPGSQVKKGQILLQLLPLLTPEGRANLSAAKIEAEGQVKSARRQLEASKLKLDRARQLLKSEAGSRRAVEEAQADFDLRQRALEASEARFELLAKAVGDTDDGTAAPLDIKSPADGMLRNVTALPGQNVPSGAMLFEVVNLSQVWIKVPIYVGDMGQIDAAADALVSELAAGPGARARTAKPVAAPPSADAATGTVDSFYVLENEEQKYTPGQRVSVTLPLSGEAESLTVPWSAVVFDIYGGAWLYEQTDERTFVRRRVVVRQVADGTAVLASGPPIGAKIVTAGAAELFGTETGFSK